MVFQLFDHVSSSEPFSAPALLSPCPSHHYLRHPEKPELLVTVPIIAETSNAARYVINPAPSRHYAEE